MDKNKENKPHLLVIGGATASGKSSLALEMAQRHDGEIISADSMQLYRGMDIGTAKPTDEERRAVPHHMLDIISPAAQFSSCDYADAAADVIDDVTSRGHLPVLCGGTGLYIDALIYSNDYSSAGGNEAVRRELEKFADEHGIEALHDRLSAVDPEAAASIHQNNVRRVIRAIEIFEETGKTKTEWDRDSRMNESEYDCRIVIIAYHRRDTLYSRIDRRVDIMMSDGLEREVHALYDSGLLDPDTTAGQAIGYKEFVPYFKGEITLDEVSAMIKQSTRRYAKRQLTWFRRYTDAITVYGDDTDGRERSVCEIYEDTERMLGDTGFFG